MNIPYGSRVEQRTTMFVLKYVFMLLFTGFIVALGTYRCGAWRNLACMGACCRVGRAVQWRLLYNFSANCALRGR